MNSITLNLLSQTKTLLGIDFEIMRDVEENDGYLCSYKTLIMTFGFIFFYVTLKIRLGLEQKIEIPTNFKNILSELKRIKEEGGGGNEG